MTVHVWDKVEIRLRAERAYANPYADMLVWVDLEGPGFSRRCYGFWDGGDEFEVRVTATVPGTWVWRSGSSPGDTGLSGKSGTFEAVPWTEEEKTENACRRGFLRPDGHVFRYADGSPCFLLGDTWWSAGTFRFPYRPGDDGRTPRSFPNYVALRKRQGFNCVAIIAALPNWTDDGLPATLIAEDGTVIRAAWRRADADRAKPMHDEDGNGPFIFPGKVPGYENSVPDLDRIDPLFFRNLDRKIDLLNANGIIPFIEPARRDIGQVWKKFHGWPRSYARYVGYVWSRYQANNCLLSPVHYDTGELSIPAPDWNRAANAVVDSFGPPPFGNPVGCNPHWNSLMDFGHTAEARWLTFHQAGNGQRGHHSFSQLTDLFSCNPPVPALNGEPQYEGMTTLTHPGDVHWYFGNVRIEDSPSEEGARVVRSAAYGSVLSGGLAGHIYGSGGWDGGVWRGDVEDASPVKVWEGMEWPGAAQLRHLGAFILSEGERFVGLRPAVGMMDPNRHGPVAGYEGWAYCAATEDSNLILAYLEKGTPPESVRGLAPESRYRLAWFDPRSGIWSRGTSVEADGTGRVRLPSKPTDDDWALKMEAFP